MSSNAKDMVARLDGLRAASTLETQLDAALERLAKLADLPLRIFAEAGLPDRLGRYARLRNGAYLPLEVRLNSSEKLTHQNDPPHDAEAIFDLAGIGLSRFPRDSRVGFAAAVIAAIEELRCQLRKAAERGDGQSVRSINQAMITMSAHQALRLEYVDGPDIAAGRDLSASGRRNVRAEWHAKKRAGYREWQQRADAVWVRNPHLSKASVARIVSEAIGETSSPERIRKVIQKPGHLGAN